MIDASTFKENDFKMLPKSLAVLLWSQAIEIYLGGKAILPQVIPRWHFSGWMLIRECPFQVVPTG